MALIRWEPSREIESLQQEVNRLFGSFFEVQPGRASSDTARSWLPAVDLVESERHYVLHADLPGVEPGDVKVELDDDVLTVSGERKTSSETREHGVHRRERGYGRFSRSLTLPAGIDPDAIEASFDKGVLEVRIPKPEQPKPRRVEIQVGASNADAVIEGAESAEQAHSEPAPGA